MPANDQQLNQDQENVRKLAESYEGPEKKEVAELYVDRIAKLKTAIMDSQMSDFQKEEYLKRMDSYLKIVDADNLERLRKEYDPLLKSMESGLNIETKEKAQDDREAKLDEITDLRIREKLLKEWKEATKFVEKFGAKKEQIDLLMKMKKLDAHGTVLQYPMTSIQLYSLMLSKSLQAYYETKDVGEKHKQLKAIIDQQELFYQVEMETEKALQQVQGQDDLERISLADRSVLAEQSMFMNLERFQDNKKEFLKKMEDMKVPKDNPLRKQMEEKVFPFIEMQFEDYKQSALLAKTPAERTAYAEKANDLLEKANLSVEQANSYLKAFEIKDIATKEFLETARYEKAFKEIPFLKKLPTVLCPQLAIGLGYYEAAQRGEATGDTAGEIADFGISIVPVVGGAWDIGNGINGLLGGKTISGRKMGTAECWIRIGVGAVSLVVDIFTFGIGGTLIRAGTKAAVEVGIKMTAEAAAKAALEGAGKTGVEAGVKALTKEGVEVAGRVGAEEAAKAGGEALTKEGAETAGKVGVEAGKEGATTVAESTQKATVQLTKEEQEAIVKGLQKGADSAARDAMRQALKSAVDREVQGYIAKLTSEEAARIAAEKSGKIVSRTVNIAARRTEGLVGYANKGLSRVSGGLFERGGAEGIAKRYAATKLEEEGIKGALEAGKEVGMGYFVKSAFVKEGEVQFGKMAASMGKEAGKTLLHLHNPLEVLKFFKRPAKFLLDRVRFLPLGIFENKATLTGFEQEAKAAFVDAGYELKDIEPLFADVKEKPWQQFLEENKNSPILQDKDYVAFFEAFQKQFPKNDLLKISAGGKFFADVQKGDLQKAYEGLYKGFKTVENDTFMSARMTYDSRRMEWPAFAEKYKESLSKATPDQLKSFEEQFKNLHSLSEKLPVNVAKIRERREAVTLTEEQIKKLNKEARALQKEKEEIESVMEKYADILKKKEKKGIVVTDADRADIWADIYEKMPDGAAKNAVNEYRDSGMKFFGIEAEAGSKEYKQYTYEAMVEKIPERYAEVVKQIEAKQDELKAAGVELEDQIKAHLPQKLEKKVPLREVTEKRGEQMAAALEKAAKNKREVTKQQELKNQPATPPRAKKAKKEESSSDTFDKAA